MINTMAKFNLNKYIGETTAYDKKESVEIKKPKSWLKSVSAFANTSGGLLIFGVDENNVVCGIDDFQKASEDISELIKTRLDPVPEVRLRIEKISAKTIILLEILHGDYAPYFYVGDSTQIAYIRIGNESVPATATDLRRLVINGLHQSFDSQITDYEFKDFAFSKLRSVYKQKTGNSMSDDDFVSFEVINSDGRLTNAGALLADEPPYRQSRIFCTRWNGIDKAGGSLDALDDSEFSGSLIALLQDGMAFFARNNRMQWKKLPTSRLELPDYPERAVFECLVNALIHRDYLVLGSEVHFDIFDDRLEIYSPGGMFDGSNIQDRDVTRVPSIRRNPLLADIFTRLNYMERKGSGFKKIQSACESEPNYLPTLAPEYYSTHSMFVATIRNMNYFVNQANEGINEGINEGLNEGLNGYGEQVLDLITKNPRITYTELSICLKVSEATILRYINHLKKSGYIVREGARKTGFWRVLK